ncbi:ABC transporter ATP-binding protein [Brevibacillus migulae]|uniref:ABC transporter ATP-binding protein n=1 Tax=Brevibacillus migulae TaxID=1644114 RepID=UPI00106EDCB5|nr:ABC transporter ATP-binding protein [Brevibacillus migulae]
MSYVRIEQVSKRYHQEQVLKEVSLTIEKGALVTLLGPSGCGKSTLLRCIAGLTDIEPGGKMIVGETDITNRSPKEREVGMVFQSYALFPNLTVFDNIAFGLKMKGLEKRVYTEKVEQIIRLVDLTGREQQYPHQLSGGQQQRVALARSLVVEPKILLLDEPLSALDAKIRKNLQMELRRIQKALSITTVFVTHDQEEAMTVSDHIFIMDQGRIVQAGTPDEIYRSPANEFVARFIGSYNVLNAADWKSLVAEQRTGSYAVRPEVIRLLPIDAPDVRETGWHFTGKVREKTLKGNVIRAQIVANGIPLHVDMLNTSSQHDIHEGMDVRVFIPESECVPLD